MARHMVPYGQKKVVHTTATWHPNPEPDKGAERARQRKVVANDVASVETDFVEERQEVDDGQT